MEWVTHENRHFVLLVGRNPIVRNLLASVVAGANYSVLTAADEAEATIVLNKYPDRVSALVVCGAYAFAGGPVITVKSALADELSALTKVQDARLSDLAVRELAQLLKLLGEALLSGRRD